MKNLFLFTGEETYLLNNQIKDWKNAFKEKHGDMNLEILDSNEIPLNEIMAAALAMPFLSDKRLIFIHGLPDSPKIRNADKVSKKDEKRDEDLKKFAVNLDNIPESSVVVFVQPNPDKRFSFYKNLTKKAEIKEFNPLQGQMLNSWIQNEVKKKGCSIDLDSAEYLASLTGQDLWRLSSEISKISSHSPNVAFNKTLIDKLVVPTLEANIFHFTDALAARDHKRAIHKLHETMLAGDNLRPLFYMIVRQFRLLLQANGYISNNPTGNSSSFASSLKLHPFVAKNTFEQVRHFKTSELIDAYQNLLDIDVDMKTSKIRMTTDDQDELALAIERFILRFCCK
ncbi:DNA polymerase III subunit delta [Candidatus Peregrinibacteria bacterium]|nr:DNA polymerase III subunit delta [Candidatus Peregrinibacteria bacterium]